MGSQTESATVTAVGAGSWVRFQLHVNRDNNHGPSNSRCTVDMAMVSCLKLISRTRLHAAIWEYGPRNWWK